MTPLQKMTRNSVMYGRDDQAGFRLNSTYTHKQYPSLGTAPSQTTHTDFVGKVSTILQVSSYNFPETEKTPEVCADS